MSTNNHQDVRGQVGFLIKRVQQALRNKIDTELAIDGLTTPQYAVLVHLRENAKLSNAELARNCFVTAPTMVRIVRDLEKMGHIAKTKSTVHGRVINIVITEQGEKVLIRCEKKVTLIQEKMLEGMSYNEISLFSKLLIQTAKQLESR